MEVKVLDKTGKETGRKVQLSETVLGKSKTRYSQSERKS
jgi:hypothetical protein